MNKGELIQAVAANGLTKKDAEAAVNAVFGTIGDARAKGESVQLVGFGTFSVKKRAARGALTRPLYGYMVQYDSYRTRRIPSYADSLQSTSGTY